MYHIQTDTLGTPRTITNATDGSLVWSWDNSEAFGNNSNSNTGLEFNLRFSGQYFDDEKGSSYNINRDYASGLGRYIQSDPIGLNGGINTYGYVQANPMNYNDPMGLEKVFAGDQSADKNMLESWGNDPDDIKTLILYGHGGIDGFFISYNNSLMKNFDEKGKHIKTTNDLVEFLNLNKIDINKYDNIVFKACDVGTSKLPQQLANDLNKKVYAADDYYFFSDRSVGVRSTIRFKGPKGEDRYKLETFSTPRSLKEFTPITK